VHSNRSIFIEESSTEYQTSSWYGNLKVHDVLIFHAVLLVLQPVAAGSQIRGMKQGEQV
jgi:hypothetical protein